MKCVNSFLLECIGRLLLLSLIVVLFVALEGSLKKILSQPDVTIECKSVEGQIDELFERIEPRPPFRLVYLAAAIRQRMEEGVEFNLDGKIPVDADIPQFDTARNPLVDYWGSQYMIGVFPVISLSIKGETDPVFYRRIDTIENISEAKKELNLNEEK